MLTSIVHILLSNLIILGFAVFFYKRLYWLGGFAVLLASTAISMYVPVSLFPRIPSGTIMIGLAGIMVLDFTMGNRWKLSSLHKLIYVYISLSFLFLIVAIIRFSEYMDSSDTMSLIATFANSIIALIHFFVVYYLLIRYQQFERIVYYALIGGAIMAICSVAYLYYTGGYSYVGLDLSSAKCELGGFVKSSVLEYAISDDTIGNDTAPVRLAVFYGLTSYSGPLVAMLTAYLLGVSSQAKLLKIRVGISLLVIFGLIVTVASASRSSILSIGVIAVLFLRQFANRRYGMVFLASVIILATAFILQFQGFGYEAFTSSEPRQEMWTNLLPLVVYNPIGNGFRYIANVQTFHAGNFPAYVDIRYNHIHNTYLEILVDNGVVALVVMLAMMLMLLRTASRNAQFYNQTHNVRLAGMAHGTYYALVSASIHFMFGSFLGSYTPYSTMFWIFAAVVMFLHVFRMDPLHAGTTNCRFRNLSP